MELTIPEGAQVTVTIWHGSVPAHLLPAAAAFAPYAATEVARVIPAHSRRYGPTALIGACGALLLLAAFAAGQRSGPSGKTLVPLSALAMPRTAGSAGQASGIPNGPSALPAETTASREERAFPDRPVPRQPSTATAPAGQDIPQSFRDTLAQTPRVTPPPGQPAAAPVQGQAPLNSAGPVTATSGTPPLNPFGLQE